MNPPVLVPFLVFSLRITEGDRHPFLFTENHKSYRHDESSTLYVDRYLEYIDLLSWKDLISILSAAPTTWQRLGCALRRAGGRVVVGGVAVRVAVQVAAKKGRTHSCQGAQAVVGRLAKRGLTASRKLAGPAATESRRDGDACCMTSSLHDDKVNNHLPIDISNRSICRPGSLI